MMKYVLRCTVNREKIFRKINFCVKIFLWKPMGYEDILTFKLLLCKDNKWVTLPARD